MPRLTVEIDTLTQGRDSFFEIMILMTPSQYEVM